MKNTLNYRPLVNQAGVDPLELPTKHLHSTRHQMSASRSPHWPTRLKPGGNPPRELFGKIERLAVSPSGGAMNPRYVSYPVFCFLWETADQGSLFKRKVGSNFDVFGLTRTSHLR